VTTAFPLAWPIGWARVPAAMRERARFGERRRAPGSAYSQLNQKTVAQAVGDLLDELRRLGVDSGSIVISTNIRTKTDGTPYSNQRDPDDTGVAIYLTLNRKQIVFACDTWDRVADNIYAVACHIEALRGINRWGVGEMARAFTGYAALPDPNTAGAWWRVLGIPSPNATADEINDAWRRAMRTAHPDAGGDAERAAALNVARDEGLKAIGAK
jgi:hypothetical protein